MGKVFSKCVNTNGAPQHEEDNNTRARKDTYKRSHSREKVNISNKVEIGSFNISIGNNAKTVNINNFSGSGSKQTNKSTSKRSNKDENGGVKTKEIFNKGYTSQSTQGLENFAEEPTATGNFIDVSDAKKREFMYIHKGLGTLSDSVCQIRFPGGTGTGFRVGSKCIMTALHVVKEILDSVYRRIEGQTDDQNWINALQDNNVYCIFAYLERFDPDDGKRYSFVPVVHFKNEETDTAVLELVEHSDGTHFPPPFEQFGFPNFRGNFHLVGHEGGQMETNKVDKIIDKSHPQTREDIIWVKALNDAKTNQSYEYPPYSLLSNENRILFHCKFSKGASGSPGVIVMEDKTVVVVTMLLCGYPNWRYDVNADAHLRAQWPQEYCIEQGANMLKIGSFMYDENQELYQDIFCRQLPRPNLT